MSTIYEHHVLLHHLLVASSERYRTERDIGAAVAAEPDLVAGKGRAGGAKRKAMGRKRVRSAERVDEEDSTNASSEGEEAELDSARPVGSFAHQQAQQASTIIGPLASSLAPAQPPPSAAISSSISRALALVEATTSASAPPPTSSGPSGASSSNNAAPAPSALPARTTERLRPKWAHVTPMKRSDIDELASSSPISRARTGRVEVEIQVVPVKRGRGRPSKVRAEEGDEQDASGSGAAQRGENAAEYATDKHGAEENDEPPIKRKRGRPRKSAPEQDGANEQNKPNGTSASGAAENIASVPVKRPVGRPRKSIPPPADTGANAIASTSAITQDPPIVKRPCGRPRKSLVPSAPTAAPAALPDANGPVNTESSPTTPIKRGRGRPRKSLLGEAGSSIRTNTIDDIMNNDKQGAEGGISNGIVTHGQQANGTGGPARADPALPLAPPDSSGREASIESRMDADEVDELATPKRGRPKRSAWV